MPQECHEEIRKLSQLAAAEVKEHGRDNNLVELIKESSYFSPVYKDLDTLLDPKGFVGRAPEQVCFDVYNLMVGLPNFFD